MLRRSFDSLSDLRRMQEAASSGIDATLTRVGDIAWRARYRTPDELVREITLWVEDGRVAAYAWLRAKGGFDVFIEPARPRDDDLRDEMLDVVEESWRDARQANDAPRRIYTFFNSEDHAMAAALLRRDFNRADQDAQIMRGGVESLSRIQLPRGFTFDFVHAADIDGRVAAHRAAFAPSDMTRDIYERVRRTWPYRPELDRIVRGVDGEVAAFCTAWIDEASRTGLLEPVGVVPEHWNRGLARAVVADAALELGRAGATVVQIGTSAAAAARAYAAAGFRKWADEVTYEKFSGAD